MATLTWPPDYLPAEQLQELVQLVRQIIESKAEFQKLPPTSAGIISVNVTEIKTQLKLPKYASWAGYEANLPFVLRRYCGLWGRGF